MGREHYDTSTAPMQMPPDSEPTTQATTAVATPVESKANSRAASIKGGPEGAGPDLEKGHGGRGISGTIYSSHNLGPGEYSVPVLGQGIKTALTQPVSRFTKYRVWYNPYRQVGAEMLSLGVTVLLTHQRAFSSLRSA